VGGAASLLKTPRGVAFVALAAGLTAWYYAVDSVPALSDWWDVVLLSCVLIPAVFAFDLIVLPLSKAKGLFPLSVALGGSSNAVPLMNPGVEFGNITGAALVLISVTLALSATGTAAMTAVAWPSAVITTS